MGGYGAESVRLYSIGHIFTIISIPLFLSCIIKIKPRAEKFFMMLIIILFVLLAIISVFTIHPTIPFTNMANDQVTELKSEAISTFFKYHENLPIIENGIAIKRYAYPIYGTKKARNIIDMPLYDPLNYDQWATFAQGLGSNRYLFINLGSQYNWNPTSIFDQDSSIIFIDLKTPLPTNKTLSPWILRLAKLNIKMENDNTVNKIYSNSPVYIYLVL